MQPQPAPARASAAGDASLVSAWTEAPPAARALLILQTGSLLLLTVTVITRYWQDHVWLGYGLLAGTALIWSPEVSRRRFRTWWFAYVAGIFLYTLLRSHADDTAIPIRSSYVIDFDEALFFGHSPVVWLQDRLFDRRDLTPLDWIAVQVHWSYFVVPHAAALAIFVYRRELFPRFVVAAVTTMWLGLLLFFLVPTTPPWLAGQSGELGGAVRIMDFVGGQVNGDTYEAFHNSLGQPNVVAAMPSIHIAVTAIVYFWARSYFRRLAPWLAAYTVVMGAALVYLAEHYVMDLMVGLAVAWLAWRLSAWIPARATAGGTR